MCLQWGQDLVECWHDELEGWREAQQLHKSAQQELQAQRDQGLRTLCGIVSIGRLAVIVPVGQLTLLYSFTSSVGSIIQRIRGCGCTGCPDCCQLNTSVHLEHGYVIA